MSRTRRLSQLLIALVGIALVASVGVVGLAGRRPSAPPSANPGGSGAVPSTGLLPGDSDSGELQASPGEEELDTIEGIDSRAPIALPARIELYAGAVSLVAGEQLSLHVSTPAPRYGYSIERLDALLPSGRELVASGTAREGHDYRSRVTFDSLDRTARANWPVTDTVATTGWTPGVYIVTARDSDGTLGRAIFVIRTPTLSAAAPVFMFTALTYQAYNLWGGANLYSYAAPRAIRVSFERPYGLEEGTGYWDRQDDRILAWLQRRRLPLQYTTDYDLAVDPPTVAPRLLIVPRHAEYVTASLRDWVEEHVNTIGDMNVLSLGANGFYWQIRLAQPRTPGAPMEIVCYKSATADPLAAADPGRATTRWRQPPLNRPEGVVFGAQYVGVVGNGETRSDYTVSAAMPAELLAGTEWRPGSVIRGLLSGEGDLVYPDSGGIAVMAGRALDSKGAPLETSVTIRTSPVGARVFDAGSFSWADGFAPPATDLGVAAGSFDRFNRNVLGWLGFPVSE